MSRQSDRFDKNDERTVLFPLARFKDHEVPVAFKEGVARVADLVQRRGVVHGGDGRDLFHGGVPSLQVLGATEESVNVTGGMGDKGDPAPAVNVKPIRIKKRINENLYMCVYKKKR